MQQVTRIQQKRMLDNANIHKILKIGEKMIKEIHIIDCNNDLIMMIRGMFEQEKAFRFRNINPEKLDISLKSIPSLIIINEESANTDVIELCKKLERMKTIV